MTVAVLLEQPLTSLIVPSSFLHVVLSLFQTCSNSLEQAVQTPCEQTFYNSRTGLLGLVRFPVCTNSTLSVTFFTTAAVSCLAWNKAEDKLLLGCKNKSLVSFYGSATGIDTFNSGHSSH